MSKFTVPIFITLFLAVTGCALISGRDIRDFTYLNIPESTRAVFSQFDEAVPPRVTLSKAADLAERYEEVGTMVVARVNRGGEDFAEAITEASERAAFVGTLVNTFASLGVPLLEGVAVAGVPLGGPLALLGVGALGLFTNKPGAKAQMQAALAEMQAAFEKRLKTETEAAWDEATAAALMKSKAAESDTA